MAQAGGEDVDMAESLGSGIEKQLDKFNELQGSLQTMQADFVRLRTQVAALKTERAALQTSSDTLKSEIGSLKSERDGLRIEYAHASEQNRWWTQRDVAASSSSSSSSPAPEFGELGKLRRRIWVLEEKNKALEMDLRNIEVDGEARVDGERAISAGLRDRIGRLEGRVREAERVAEDVKAEAEGERKFREAIEERERDRIEALEETVRDMGAKLEGKAKQVREVLERLERAEREKCDVMEELRMMNEKSRDVGPDTPRKRKALESLPTNTRSPIPLTPTKPRSSTPNLISPSCLLPPTTSLARRYAHLEEQHRLLRDEHDKLRKRYAEDLRHWKEYKALEEARNEVKRKRRAEKALETSEAARGVEVQMREKSELLVEASDESHPMGSQERLAAEPATHSTAPTVSPETTAVGNEGGDEEEEVEDDPRRSTQEEQAGVAALSSSQRTDDDATPKRRSQRQAEQRSSIARTPDVGAAQASNAQTAHQKATGPAQLSTADSSRKTPWLGGSGKDETPSRPSSSKRPRRSSTAKMLPVDPDEDYPEVDLSPPNTPQQSATSWSAATTDATPLVRDRLGALQSDHSLRRTALLHSTRKPEPANIPVTPNAQQQSASKASSSAKRRADLDLSMTDLSPAQKAQRLKQLNKLSASEKREMYKGYKGKGRYLAPDDLDKSVRDDFVIDREKNEGREFAFHDVKRGRAERRAMHGGDCECCREYYEAIGPLPKYNQAPRWKDDPVPHDQSVDGGRVEEGMREHQNKVSRHRETWRRPPTPPGFWQIGFPTTQDVEKQNAQADMMVREREEQIRREAAHKDSKWRKK